MIDGIDITYFTDDENTHLLQFPCWEILINEKTGKMVNDTRTANIRGLNLKLKPSKFGGFNLLINGSLHKYFNMGETNTTPFTFLNLVQSIDSITDILGINPAHCYIHGLEIGLNINLNHSPQKTIKKAVSFGSKAFTPINKKSPEMGLECSLTQYRFKMYDKAKQSEKDVGNLLRIENHVDKMQAIASYQISTLADLQNEKKVYPLLNILIDCVDNIIWTDNINLKTITPREQKQWLYFSNPRSWQMASKDKRKHDRKKWFSLLTKYTSMPDLITPLKSTWESLFFNQCAALFTPPFYQHKRQSAAPIYAPFLPFIWTVKMGHITTQNITPIKSDFGISVFCNMYPYTGPAKFKKTPSKKITKNCLSCGRDISTQQKNSRFCSEAKYGKAGKACRNKRSNINRTCKRVLNHARECGKYIIVSYRANGSNYSDSLHPDEITLTNDWFYSVQKMKILN